MRTRYYLRVRIGLKVNNKHKYRYGKEDKK